MAHFIMVDGALPGLTFLGAASSAASGTSVSFSVGLGTPSSDRIILACFGCRTGTGSAVPTMTIAGVAATDIINVKATQPLTQDVQATIFVAAVPTGTSGTIVASIATGFAANAGLGFGLYAMTGLINGGAASAGNAATGSAATGMTLSLNVPANGIAVGMEIVGLSPGPPSNYSWGGLNRDFQAALATASSMSSASLVVTSAQTPLGVSVVSNGVGGAAAAVSASFR